MLKGSSVGALSSSHASHGILPSGRLGRIGVPITRGEKSTAGRGKGPPGNYAFSLNREEERTQEPWLPPPCLSPIPFPPRSGMRTQQSWLLVLTPPDQAALQKSPMLE